MPYSTLTERPASMYSFSRGRMSSSSGMVDTTSLTDCLSPTWILVPSIVYLVNTNENHPRETQQKARGKGLKKQKNGIPYES